MHAAILTAKCYNYNMKQIKNQTNYTYLALFTQHIILDRRNRTLTHRTMIPFHPIQYTLCTKSDDVDTPFCMHLNNSHHTIRLQI